MRTVKFVLAVAAVLTLVSAAAQAQDMPPKVWIQTSMGDFLVELDPAHAPLSVENFLRYVNEGHYDGTIVYRVQPGFVIQLGSYNPDLSTREVHDPIPLESDNGLSNLRGSLAMARDDPPDSAKAEFFVNLADNPGLDRSDAIGQLGYAVFGRVVYGMEVVDAISMVALNNEGVFENANPAMPVIVTRAVLAP